MSLLYPAMLAGLLGMAVPIALHLIARHRFPVRDFPAIRLLQKDLRTNVFAPKLVDVLQLLLRLLVLLLLALAMSRIFAPSLSTDAAPRNLIIVIDASAGMRMQLADETGGTKSSLLEKARAQAKAMIEKLGAGSQSAVILAAEKADVLTPLNSDAAPALKALETVDAIDGKGCGIVRGVAAACDLAAGRREAATQIVVLTDMRANAFASRDQKDVKRIEAIRKSMGDKLHLYVLDVTAGGELENVGITDAYVRGRGSKVGDDAHVVATLRNAGEKPKTARIRLQVGDRKEPQVKEISIEPGAEAVVDMTARVQRAANTVASVHIAEDAYKSDDAFSVPLNVTDTRRILVVNGSSAATEARPNMLAAVGNTPPDPHVEAEATIDGATIFRYVLNPGRELGLPSGTGIDVTVVTPEAVAAQTLSKYDMIALYDVSSLPETALDDLTTFVKEGRSALIVCGANSQALTFNRTLAAGTATRPALAPALLGNDKSFDPPLDIQQTGNTHPLVAIFQDKLRGDLSVIRMTKARELQSLSDGARVILNATSGQPLAIERELGHGRVLMLTFSFELDRGNAARARAFPPLVWRMVDYLTGQLRQRPPDVVKALTPAVLDVSETAFSFANELALVPESRENTTAVTASEDRTALIPPMPAGRFQLTKAGADGAARAGYSRYVTTFIDPIESDTRRQDANEIPALLGGETIAITAKDTASLALPGGEMWTLLVVMLTAAYLAEAAFAYIQGVKRERQRSQEGAA